MSLFGGPPNVEKMKNARDVKGLIKALSYTKQETIRYDAAKALEAIGDARAVEPLVAALRDSDTGVRRASAEALGKIGDARAVEPLIATLHDINQGLRRASAEALGKIGDVRAIEPLVAALHDSEFYVYNTARSALTMIQDSRVVEQLSAALQDSDDFFRWHVADTLADIGGAGAVEPLIAALHDSYDVVRTCAAKGLGKINDQRAIEPLMDFLNRGDFEAFNSLKAIGVDTRTTVEPLITILRKNPGSGVAKALGEIGDTRAVEPLLDALEYREDGIMDMRGPDVRAAAAEALGMLKDERAVEPLIDIFRWDKARMVRTAAASALGAISDCRAVEPLLELFDAENVAANIVGTQETMAALQNMGLGSIASGAAKTDFDLYRAAASALGKLGDARAVMPLEFALRVSDFSSIHTTIKAALEELEKKAT